MENMLSNWGTNSVCKVGFAGPRDVRGTVWPFWNQPDGWVQMEEAIYSRRSERSQRPFATSSPFAPSDQPALGEMDPAAAAATSHLGRTQNFGVAEKSVPWCRFAIGTDDCHLPENHEADEGAATSTSGSVDKAAAPDAGQEGQSSLDSRLQRVVSNWRRAEDRTIDCARFVQSLWFGGSVAQEPTMEASARDHEKFVPTLWTAGGDTRRQWNAFWIHRTSGAVAIERMVDQLGNTGGVHRPWTSGTKWSARTVSSSAQKRNDASAGDNPTGSTAAQQQMAQRIQYRAATRRFEAAHASLGVSTMSAPISSQTNGISGPVANATAKNKRRG
jgi:hypothetical protein